MNYKTVHGIRLILPALVLAMGLANSPVLAQPVTDSQIKRHLQEEVDKNHVAPGIVVGFIDERGSRVIAYGKRRGGASLPVDGDTIFEIGSATKVFTTLLLQEMVDDGGVKLDDPIGKFLPAGVKTPSRNGRQITLVNLATHTAGLPKLPSNMSASYLQSRLNNPYADYGPQQLYEYLSNCTLTRDIGAQYEYSNLGVGLLGHLLSLKAGTSYESLVVDRICKPLGMGSTRITFTPEMTARLATGHEASWLDVDNWDFDALAGCGAIRSSVNDMLKFLSANMGLVTNAVSEAMQKTHVPICFADRGRKIGLGWQVNDNGSIWHNGQTAGYHSFIGFNPETHCGVVVLANAASDGIDSIGLSLLIPPKAHEEVKIDPQIYDQYVGTYSFNPQVAMTVTRDGDRLLVQLTGQGALEVFPESETDFFLKAVDAQVTFVKDSSGKVTHLILHQNGLDQKARKTR